MVRKEASARVTSVVSTAFSELGTIEAVLNPVRLLDVFSIRRSASPLFYVNSGGSFAVVHRDGEDSVGVDNLPITAAWALCFVANVFIHSCAICFGDYLDSYAAFAAPCSNSLNHKSGPPKTSCRNPNMELIQTSEQRATAKKVLSKQATSALMLWIHKYMCRAPSLRNYACE